MNLFEMYPSLRFHFQAAALEGYQECTFGRGGWIPIGSELGVGREERISTFVVFYPRAVPNPIRIWYEGKFFDGHENIRHSPSCNEVNPEGLATFLTKWKINLKERVKIQHVLDVGIPDSWKRA